MRFRDQARTYTALRTLLCVLSLWIGSAAQIPQNPRREPTTPQQPPLPEPEPRRQDKDEVVRVFTELVQTDVMVFDKQGQFVSGLRPENFELRIDGKLRPIHSFEQIAAGSNEEAQLAAARGSSVINQTGNPTKGAVPLDRGRTVFFYVDDFHLDLDGWTTARKLITNFVDKEMGQNDEAAIISASGQVGFLQQLTDNKLVLHTALKRIIPREDNLKDGDRPVINEYHALLIERNDFDATGYFIDETMKFNPGMTRDMAAAIVTSRAHALLSQSANITGNTLASLELLIRSIKTLPGRKVLFFLSKGFFMQNRHADSASRITQVASAAAKASVVIYAMDMRGLVAPFSDISNNEFDTTGRLQRANAGELSASQDPLNALARDSGGKPIFNTNDFRPGLQQALKETSVYYLLVWKPEKSGGNSNRFRNIQVSITGRTDLTVRVRRGFFETDTTPPTTPTANAKSPAKPLDPDREIATQMRQFLVAQYPDSKLPLSFSLDYHDFNGKGLLSASVQVPGEFVTFGPEGDKIQAMLDVVGAFYNDRGQALVPFFERIVSTAKTAEAALGERPDVTYTYPASLPPGLYQARVVVRDKRTGRTGSARAWMEVPDLSNHELVLSSLLLGERIQPSIPVSDTAESMARVNRSATHRFHSESNLRFLVFVYNAALAPADSKPDAAIQIQVVRDDQPVLTTGLRRVTSEGGLDPLRLPYAAEIPLAGMAPGRYSLLVTVIDRVSKRSASQRTRFDVY